MRNLKHALFCALALLTPFPAAAASIVFLGATVIDGTGATPIPDGAVLVNDGRIVAAGLRASVAIPDDAQRIDVTGKTIMPGLVNAHGHLGFDAKSGAAPRTQIADQLALYARYGVTSVYSLGDDGVESVKLRDELRKDPKAQAGKARMWVSGPVLNPKDPADARRATTENAKMGVDIIKTRLEGPKDIAVRQPAVYGAMIDQAHKEKLRMAVHMFFADETKGVLDAGTDILAHSVRDRDVDSALIAQIKSRDIGYIPTLTRELSVFVYESRPSFIDDPFFAKEQAYRGPLQPLLQAEAQAKVVANMAAQSIKAALVQAKRNLKILSDAGVTIGMGTDTGASVGRWQGYFEHVELEMMADAGLTPMQVLTAATSGSAKVMRIDDQVGTLRPGRHADLLVLSANPAADIRNTRTIEQVWIGGAKLN
jgi:imidazolonepropionase-like amidohydrolase